MMADPAAARRMIVAFIRRMPTGSRPVSGSSRRRALGSWSSPQAIASFCFMPRDSSPGSEPRFSVEIQLLEQSGNPCVDVGHSIEPADESQVLFDREVLEEMRLVRDEGQRRLGANRILSQVVARNPDRSGAGNDDSGHAPDGGGLARAIGPDQPKDLARRHLRRRAPGRRGSRHTASAVPRLRSRASPELR